MKHLDIADGCGVMRSVLVEEVGDFVYRKIVALDDEELPRLATYLRDGVDPSPTRGQPREREDLTCVETVALSDDQLPRIAEYLRTGIDPKPLGMDLLSDPLSGDISRMKGRTT